MGQGGQVLRRESRLIQALSTGHSINSITRNRGRPAPDEVMEWAYLRQGFGCWHITHPEEATRITALGRLCCKSRFAPLIANSSSCRRGFRVNMGGTSSPGDQLTGDFGNEPDATSISDRGLFRPLAGNLSPGVFRLLQHNLPAADILLFIRAIRRLESASTAVVRAQGS